MFFRTGFPVVETFLILAKRSYESKKRLIPELEKGSIILADRDIDTVCTYQMVTLTLINWKNMRRNSELKNWIFHHIHYGKVSAGEFGNRIITVIEVWFYCLTSSITQTFQLQGNTWGLGNRKYLMCMRAWIFRFYF